MPLVCAITTYLACFTLTMRVDLPKTGFCSLMTSSYDDVIKQKCTNDQPVTFIGTWLELVLMIKQVLGRKVPENLRF